MVVKKYKMLSNHAEYNKTELRIMVVHDIKLSLFQWSQSFFLIVKYKLFKKWKNDKNILDFSNDIIHEFGTT